MRKFYRWILAAHPRGFCERFEREMLCVFDNALATEGTSRLMTDEVLSLLRRRLFRPDRLGTYSNQQLKALQPVRPHAAWLALIPALRGCGGNQVVSIPKMPVRRVMGDVRAPCELAQVEACGSHLGDQTNGRLQQDLP
jgi:hypothetical protein